jgi:hypothetical protein
VRDNVTRYATNASHHHPPPATLPNGSQPGHVSTSSFAQPSKTPTYGSFNPPHARQASTSQATASLARSRSHRQQSRSPTRPSHASFGRYATIGGAPQPISQIQTQVAPVYDYPPMQAMSAVPFSPYVEHYSVLSMVSMQMYVCILPVLPRHLLTLLVQGVLLLRGQSLQGSIPSQTHGFAGVRVFECNRQLQPNPSAHAGHRAPSIRLLSISHYRTLSRT